MVIWSEIRSHLEDLTSFQITIKEKSKKNAIHTDFKKMCFSENWFHKFEKASAINSLCLKSI